MNVPLDIRDEVWALSPKTNEFLQRAIDVSFWKGAVIGAIVGAFSVICAGLVVSALW